MNTPIKQHQLTTRDGALCLYARDGALFAGGERPVLLLIHGALRNSSVLFDWADLLAPELDVVFVDLPGHGKSPAIAAVSIESFATNIGDAITAALADRDVVIAGESLGGLVALALGGSGIGQIRGVIAADPPMTMSKLWHINAAIGNAVANDPANQFLNAFALNIFGIAPDGTARERIYYSLVEQTRVPALILTGDVPLFPIRNAHTVPCVVDDVDRHFVGRFAGEHIQLRVIADCGHVLLVNAKQECGRIIAQFCATLTPEKATP